MKKLFQIFILLFLLIGSWSCGSKPDLKDGYYQMASLPANATWSNILTFEIKNKKITNVHYDAINLYEGNKKKLSEISAKDAANFTLINKYLEANQNFNDISFDGNGKSNDIKNVTINYRNIKDLLSKALSAGPITQGKRTDGMYYAHTDYKDERNIYHTLAYYVNHGVILIAHVDGYEIKNGTKTFATIMAQEGNYDLKSIVGTYDRQVSQVDAFLLARQTLNITDLPDAISGATIKLQHWIDLYNQLDNESK